MAESTRDRLIQSAMGLFNEHGFHAVGLDNILEDVGVTKTTFYNHFESKDDLIVAVLAWRDQADMHDWGRFIRDQAGDEPRAQLIALFHMLAEWFEQADFRGCMFMNAVAEFPSSNDPVHHAAARHYTNIFGVVRDIATRAGAPDPDALAKQLLIIISGALVARRVAMSREAADTARAAAELLIDYHLPRIEVEA